MMPYDPAILKAIKTANCCRCIARNVILSYDKCPNANMVVCVVLLRNFYLILGRFLVCWHPGKSSIQYQVKVPNNHG